jgi:NAD(P)-dependent dehydrogenase (short-subunit alcohol dehydrogenase family)
LPGSTTTPDAGTRIALVTGANKGIGFEIARQLGQRAMIVLVGARSAERGEAAAALLRAEGLDAQALCVDVANDASVAAARDEVVRRFGRLDVLVNNAGVAFDLDAEEGELPMELAAETFQTNVLGVIRLIQAMQPLLEKSPSPRIVNLSSRRASLVEAAKRAGSGGREPKVYFASKAALNALTIAYARELGPLGFKVNAVSPGRCATDMTRGESPRTPAEGARIAVEMATIGDDGPNGAFLADEGAIAW